MGLVVGIAAVVIVLVGLYFWIRRRKRPRKRPESDGSFYAGVDYGDVYSRDTASHHDFHSPTGDGGDSGGDGGGGGE